jgi:GNAT superfamily N-acetyltransferase
MMIETKALGTKALGMAEPIIQLNEGHRQAAVSTLAAAFQDDPAISWMIPDPAQRQLRLPRMFDWLYSDHLRHGTAFGTADCAAVTLWRRPGRVHYHDPLLPGLWLRLLGIFGMNITRAARLGETIARHVPPGEQAWYLRYAGVRPDRQGQGLGGQAIRAGLASAAAQAMPCCLETATPGNVAIYLRLGFDIVEEWDVAGAGPHFWTMVHPPLPI